jgi:hypothetical protein
MIHIRTLETYMCLYRMYCVFLVVSDSSLCSFILTDQYVLGETNVSIHSLLHDI